MSDRYARREFERRFLLAVVPPGAAVATAAITDRYLDGTRLRLRTSVKDRGGAARTIYKLTQKLPAPDGGPGLITTLYLDAAEHAALAALPAHVIEKTRISLPPYGVDVFAPPRAGLVLAEVEADDLASLEAFAAPVGTIAEVTHDARFTGGRLAQASTDELAALLREFGLGRP